MDDIFKEQIVKKEFNKKDIFIRITIILWAIFIVFLVFTFMPRELSLIFVAIVIYVAYYLIKNQNKEYEYLITNGEIDIDVVINKTKRKTKYSQNINEFELIAHVNDKEFANEFTKSKKTIDCSSGVIKDNTYAILTKHKNEYIKIIFEPNEELVKIIFKYIPRKFYRKK